MDGIEAQQMGVGFHRPQIVDADDFDIGAPRLDDCAQHVAADTAKAIDGNFYGHGENPSEL